MKINFPQSPQNCNKIQIVFLSIFNIILQNTKLCSHEYSDVIARTVFLDMFMNTYTFIEECLTSWWYFGLYFLLLKTDESPIFRSLHHLIWLPKANKNTMVAFLLRHIVQFWSPLMSVKGLSFNRYWSRAADSIQSYSLGFLFLSFPLNPSFKTCAVVWNKTYSLPSFLMGPGSCYVNDSSEWH